MTILAGFGAALIGLIAYYFLAVSLERLGVQSLDLSSLKEIIQGNRLVYLQFMILVVWDSAAVGEELFARGFLLNRLERAFAGVRGAWLFAAIVQALVFGSLHFYQGPVGVASSAMIGFLMAMLFLVTGRNLWAPILAHGLIDSYAVTMIYLGDLQL